MGFFQDWFSSVWLENLARFRVLLYFQSTGLKGRGVIAALSLSIKILPGWLAAGFNLFQ